MSHASPHFTRLPRREPGRSRPPQDLELLRVVYIRRERPELDLPRGACGAIIEVFDRPHRAYYVEFVDADGHTTAEGSVTDDELTVTPLSL